MATELLAEVTAEEKAQACQAAMDAVQVGDVFYSSWGYDQTNVDWYEVVGRTKASVRLRKIGAKRVELGSGHDRVMPAVGQYLSDAEPKIKRLRAWWSYGSVTVSLNWRSYADLYLWDGGDKYETAAGWGH